MHKKRFLPSLGVFLLALGQAPVWAQHAHVDDSPYYIEMPGVADSNSPAHWKDGQLVLFNSIDGTVRTEGSDVFSLRRAFPVHFSPDTGSHWIEATYIAPDGTLYAWYHQEVGGPGCDPWLAVPQIGALKSTDNGHSFVDLGIVIQSGETPNCKAQNGYFAGGAGDFSVIPTRDGSYFYFLFSHYGGPPEQQGVALARIAAQDLDSPAGKVYKYRDGGWGEPGLKGQVTPILPVTVSWTEANTDAFWGPSVHWNDFLQRYVVLLNHACCSPGWPQEGVYVLFAKHLSDPTTWTKPEKILDGVGWYPQIIGLGGGETDKAASQRAPLFVGGVSRWLLTFEP